MAGPLLIAETANSRVMGRKTLAASDSVGGAVQIMQLTGVAVQQGGRCSEMKRVAKTGKQAAA